VPVLGIGLAPLQAVALVLALVLSSGLE